jgi:outer membrane immunogenic protein
MVRALALSTIALTFAASSALAADAIVYNEPTPAAAPMAPVADWTGFYVGGQLGGVFGSTGTFGLSPFTPALQGAFSPGFSGEFDNGLIGGVHVGYDQQFGNIVVGGILDISATDVEDRQNGFSTTPARYTVTRDLDYLATLRARVGYALDGGFLIYGTGGLAYGDVNFSYEQPGSGAVTTVSGDQNNNFGYTVGAGVEALVTDSISVGLEYLYTDLGKNDFNATLTGGPFGAGTQGFGTDRRFDFHTVQAKVSFRF